MLQVGITIHSDYFLFLSIFPHRIHVNSKILKKEARSGCSLATWTLCCKGILSRTERMLYQQEDGSKTHSFKLGLGSTTFRRHNPGRKKFWTKVDQKTFWCLVTPFTPVVENWPINVTARSRMNNFFRSFLQRGYKKSQCFARDAAGSPWNTLVR